MYQTVVKWFFSGLFVLFLAFVVLSAQKQSDDTQKVTNTTQTIYIKSLQDKNETDQKIERLITLAESKLGNSYKPAATGPDHFDCSGFVYYLFKENGIPIARTSIDQSKEGDRLYKNTLKRGDLLFFDTANRKHVNHSGIYLANGKFIHASSGKAYGVTISDIDGWYKDKFLWGIRKIEE